MSPVQARLARKNLDRRLVPLRVEPLIAPPHGWIKAAREALGMTAAQLAHRMGVVQSRVSTLEKAELNGTPSLKTLREAAEAMHCTLVYAIVPTTTFEGILLGQAAKKVDEELTRIHHTMRLENQAMDTRDLAAERERLVADMLAGSLRRLWVDE
ncbi:MAG: mobile mystery protein A [Sphingorhabdus sp.]|uniref:mobile mystery protein A n=1 Tax=Sphingorhabdus sp. TaxID=1902408 RepID=UPI0038FC8694